MQSLARDLAAGLSKVSGSAVVAVSALESDTKTTRPDALALLVGSLLAGQRGWTPPSEVEPLAAAVVRGRGSASVVYVRVRIQAGRLRATADVHPIPGTVWARVKNPVPGATAHTFADAALDAEVRSYLEPVPLVAALDFSRGRHFDAGVLALACEDFDRDGAPEIASVSKTQVALVRLRGGKVQADKSRLWSDISPMDPSPWREPMAVAFSAPAASFGLPAPFELVVSSTDRLKSVRLDGSLSTVSEFPAFALPEAGAFACARLGGDTLTGPLERCKEGEPAPKRASVSGRFDAFAAAMLVAKDGKPFEVWAGREGGVVEVRDSDGRMTKIKDAGAQIAVGDLDQDGAPEIMTSLDVELGKPDAVLVSTWDRSGKAPPQEKLRIPIASGVRAIAVCPALGPGRSPLVIASTDEIVVAR